MNQWWYYILATVNIAINPHTCEESNSHCIGMAQNKKAQIVGS